MSRLKLPITAKTKEIFQRSSLANVGAGVLARAALGKILSSQTADRKYVDGFPQQLACEKATELLRL
jgi:hypothetical protein